jgi:acetyl-CoA C-acetyltransferase
MTRFSRQAAVVGVHEHETRWAPDKTDFQIAAESARAAVVDAGLRLQDVDGYFVAGVSGMAAALMCDHLNMRPKVVDSTSIGGTSFLAHAAHAVSAIATGRCDVALITYGSTAASNSVAIGTRERSGVEIPEQYEAPYGVTTVGAYALCAQRHMYEFGTTSEQLAEIAVTFRRYAGLNPYAKYREPISVDDVLSSRLISSPLHLLDCCIISDGGGAVVLTSAARARDCAKPPVWILGAGETVFHPQAGKRDFMHMAASQTAPIAFAQAGVTPQDIDMCMIYDSFTITVLMTLENLGFCKIGEGGDFVSNGRLALDGALPTNTDGGGMSSNHPGMRGIFLIIEAVKQLRGECGDRQVQDCRLALAHGTGGALGTRHGGVTLIMGRDA